MNAPALAPMAAARAEEPSAETAATLQAALRALALLLAPLVAAEMGAAPANDSGEWVDQCRSPLGRRQHCALARRGQLPARKVGRRWLVRRSDLDAFIHAQGEAPPASVSGTGSEDEDQRLHALLAECGVELSSPPRTKVRRCAQRPSGSIRT